MYSNLGIFDTMRFTLECTQCGEGSSELFDELPFSPKHLVLYLIHFVLSLLDSIFYRLQMSQNYEQEMK